MRVDGQDFGDLLQMIDRNELTRIVMEVDGLHKMPAQARGIATGLIKLRDEGDDGDHQLAAKSIHDYFRLWLRNRTTTELKERVEGERR